MADRLRLRVYTPERELVDCEVLEVTAQGAYGEIGVLPDHAALVTALEPGTLTYRQDGTVLQADVADREAVDAMIRTAVEFLGRLDVVVANSGVAARVATVADVDPAEWRRVLGTDLDGAFWTARAAIPHVVAAKGAFLFI